MIMQTESQIWWTDDRIQATVTPEYVLTQFRPEKRDLLKRPIPFRNGLTDHTYLGWILERTKRFFLILVHIGVPEQIFGVVDESCNDSDLPIAAQVVKDLRLFPGSDASLEKKFYKAQFKYLVRDIRQGHHIHFLGEETIPVNGVNRAVKDGIEKVHLASGVAKLYGRKRVVLDEPPAYYTEADVLAEIISARRLSNQHVLSVFSSYGVGNNVFILFTPAIECTLNSFLDSPPKHFENLPKDQRREILLNWPHCLSNGLAWLHSNRKHHGALRPSNIVIDDAYRIYLGQIDDLPITHSNAKTSDLESYQYAAPERWMRAATMQRKAPAMLSMHSGGRTARRPSSTKQSSPSSVSEAQESRISVASPTSPGLPIDMSKPTSTAYPYIPTSKGNMPRGQGRIVDRSEYAASVLSSNSSGTRQDRINSLRVRTDQPDFQSRNRKLSSASAAHSVISSPNHEGVNTTMPNSVTVAPTEVKTAVVQTWQSAQFDQYAADVFSLGAMILDIITFLSKRSSGAFSRHRSAKNRTAGRGGGVADASFHANLGQVFSWTVSLEQDAKKKGSKEEGKFFRAIGPMIEVARGCLARSAEERPDAGSVERLLEGCIQQFASSGTAHCSFRSRSRDGQLNTPGNARSGLHPLSNHPTAATLSMEQETGRGIISSSRKPALQSARWRSETGSDEQMDPTTSSLASFSFDDYNQEVEGIRRYDAEGEEADEDTVDLQSIADRPNRIQDGTDRSGWSHMHTESRASYISSSTQANSIPETQPIDSLFQPASRGPSPPPKQLTQQSLTQSQLSNTARKRIIRDVTLQRQRSSTPDSFSHTEYMSGLDMNGPRKSGSSTDSSRPRQSVRSSSDHSRGRLSVSTLASNTSTIRLEWQQRDVSPISVRDRETTPNASVSALTSPVSEDEEDSDVVYTRGHSRNPQEQTTHSSRPDDLSIAEGTGKKSQPNRMSFTRSTSENKGKKKAESTGSRRAWLQSRYSMLGGRM